MLQQKWESMCRHHKSRAPLIFIFHVCVRNAHWYTHVISWLGWASDKVTNLWRRLVRPPPPPPNNKNNDLSTQPAHPSSIPDDAPAASGSGEFVLPNWRLESAMFEVSLSAAYYFGMRFFFFSLPACMRWCNALLKRHHRSLSAWASCVFRASMPWCERVTLLLLPLKWFVNVTSQNSRM